MGRSVDGIKSTESSFTFTEVLLVFCCILQTNYQFEPDLFISRGANR